MKTLQEIELYAWVGEDDGPEPNTGEIGLKQGVTRAGTIPLVAVRRDKMEKQWPQMEGLARQTGKRRYLARFVFSEVVRATEGGQ